MHIADLHIHSRYSRATSKDGTPPQLDCWARKKGIQIVGTGDFTHPAWREELEEKLVPAEDGLYTLKEEFRLPGGGEEKTRFVVSGEISSIYKKNGKVRKVHSVILLPSLEDAKRLSGKLETIGNIHSDGRPILGLDCRDLLEITLELCPKAIYIPAHIWTPHFSLFGAFSGFDTIEECFEDLTPQIHALETGLSSDPPMNWRLSALDPYQLVSNSDAHSPSKLGREANLLDVELSYDGLYAAVQQGKGLAGTIEFFPEEGKYHYDGHRKCHLCLSPAEAEAYGGRCPVCGKKLTVGVEHRVEQLADRDEGFTRAGARPFESLVPLPDVIAASTGHAAAGPKVQQKYEQMTSKLGPEFSILRELPIEDIKHSFGFLIAEGIRRLREGKVERSPGYDGEYGTVKLFDRWEIENLDGQISLFSGEEMAAMEKKAADESRAAKLQAAAAANIHEELAAAVGVSGEAVAAVVGAHGEPAAAAVNVHEELAAAVVGAHGELSAAAVSVSGEPVAAAEGAHGEPADSARVCGETAASAAGVCAERAAKVFTNDPQTSLTGRGRLTGLNEQQREAVTAAARVTAVVAGPGTGKTKTLISRVLYLLEERKVRPSEITAVTFTNKAAAQMRERLEKELGDKRAAGAVQIGTFHSICRKLLKARGLACPLADEAVMLEAAEAAAGEYGVKIRPKQFLRQVSLWKTRGFADGGDGGGREAEAGGPAEAGDTAEAGGPAEAVSPAKAGGPAESGGDAEAGSPAESGGPAESVSPAESGGPAESVSPEEAGSPAESVSPYAEDGALSIEVMEAYQRYLGELHVMDFDDLLLEVLKLLRGEEKHEVRGQHFSFLLVDEFQDISPVEYELIRAWNQDGKELFVIGDPDQSIYGFRGSDSACFKRLREGWPETGMIRLVTNYRSVPSVVKGAAAVISHNSGEARILKPHRPVGASVRLVTAPSEMSEAIFVAKEVNRLIQGIDMLDSEAREGYGEERARGFEEIAVLYRTHRQAELLEICLQKEGIPYVVTGRESYLDEKTVRGTVGFFRSILEPSDEAARGLALKYIWNLPDQVISGSVYEAAKEKYAPMMKRGKPPKVLETWMEDMDLTGDPALKKLSGVAIFYKNMAEFMDSLLMGEEGDLKRCGGKTYTSEAVTLMTLHGSKGLEFPVVLLYGAREGLMPMELGKGPVDLEEERRLFYVGMTRAREELVITTSGAPSLFLEELPEDLLSRENARKQKGLDGGEQLSLFDFLEH